MKELSGLIAKRRCVKCKKPLTAIDGSRANGKRVESDYDERKYHKKCYKEFMENKAFIKRMQETPFVPPYT